MGDVAGQSFDVEGNNALNQDAEEKIYISPRPEHSTRIQTEIRV